MFGKNEVVGQKYFNNADDKLYITSIFLTLQGEGPYRGEPAVFVRLAKCNLACSFCFVPSTPILMADGTSKRISDVVVGDNVMSWDGIKYVVKPVINTYTNIASRLLKIEAGGRKFWVTPEHPFMTSNRGWVNAEDLKSRDVLVHFSNSERMKWFNPVNKNGSVRIPVLANVREKVLAFIHNGIIVTKVSEVTTNRAFARLYGSHTADHIVHNLEVADTHTYIANRCVVHNCDTYFDGGDWLTFNEIDQRINNAIVNYFNGTPPEWILHTDEHKRKCVLVITGGEPMLQSNLAPFLERMNQQFIVSQIESNGTVWQNIPPETTLVCSPKCSEKRGIAVKYLQPNHEVIARADYLKFVMNADQNSPYSSIPDWAHEYAAKGKKVFVSPMNIYNREPQKSKQLRSSKNDISIEERSTVDEVISFWEDGLLNMPENQKNHEYTAKYCLDHGFIFNMQLHLFASLA